MGIFNLRLSRFQLASLAILYRTFKSGLFNVFMFGLGFIAGLAIVAINVHQQAKSSSEWELLSEIQTCVVEMSQLDMEYSAKQRKIVHMLGDLRVKIAHDQKSLHGQSGVQSQHGKEEKDGSRAADVRPAADVR